MGTLPGPSPTTTPVRVALGIDPGTAIVGYAVVAARGSELSMIACDVITTPASMPMPERLQHIYHHLGEIVSTYHPGEAAMEELFFAKNARTAFSVGQARGVAMLALANGGLAVAEYTPRQVKQAVTGYGGCCCGGYLPPAYRLVSDPHPNLLKQVRILVPRVTL